MMDPDYEAAIDKRMALYFALRDAGHEATEEQVEAAIVALERNNWQLVGPTDRS